MLVEIEKFNFDKLITETSQLIMKLKLKIDGPDSLKDYKKFSKLIKKNFGQLKDKQEALTGFSDYIDNYLDK